MYYYFRLVCPPYFGGRALTIIGGYASDSFRLL
jgi:hypothetical protein